MVDCGLALSSDVGDFQFPLEEPPEPHGLPKPSARGDGAGKDPKDTPGRAGKGANGAGKPQPVVAAAAREQEIRAILKSSRKCTVCAVWKDLREYNASQSKCKECFNMVRSLQRLSHTQGCRAQIDQIERDEPKLHAALLKKYTKAREQAKKGASKLKFVLNSFILEWRTTQGTRVQEEGEMMWEGEWLEFSKGAKYGHMSRTEAEAQWAAWWSDMSIPRDENGPRGYPRLWIKTKDTISTFAQAEKNKIYRKEERLGKNVKPETEEMRMKLLSSENGMEAHESEAYNAMLGKSMQAFGSQGVKAFQEDGLTGPDLSGPQCAASALRLLRVCAPCLIMAISTLWVCSLLS